MSIRQTLLILVIVLGFFAAALSGYYFYDALKKQRVYHFSQQSSVSINLLLKAAGNWAVERGATNSGLSSAAVVTQQIQAIIAKRRTDGDAAYKVAMQQIEGYSFQGKAELVAKVKQAYADAVALRIKADENLPKPQIARDATLLKSWVPTMSKLIVLSQDLRFALTKKTAATDSELGRQAQLKHFSWVMSEFAGRERAIIGGTISADLGMDENKLARLSKFRGNVEIGWKTLKKLSSESNEEVLKSIEKTEALFFGPFEELRQSVYDAAVNGEAFPLTAQQWIDESTAAINTILATQEASTKETEAYVEYLLQAAHDELVLSGIMLGLTLLIVLIAFYVVIFRVTKPINSMTDAMQSLANGDRAVEVPATDRKDEIGKMASSVQVFKDNAIERERLEQEQKDFEAKQEARERQAEEDRKQAIKEQEDLILTEVSTIIESCSQGDFTKRLATEGKEGLLYELSAGMNKIAEVTEQGFDNIKTAFKALSDGDLSHEITGNTDGVFGEVQAAFNTTRTILVDMVARINDAASSINASANELASASNDLAQRTEHQASTLEETSASMEEITAKVTQNTNTAQSAKDISETSSSVAMRGGEIVQQVVDSMKKIQQSSDKIANIISTIDEIAFQTNLLALNASVESARAGEAGKGFAVVATEVRSLAERSANSSQEIKSLIENSVSQVNAGEQLVNQSGQSLEEIIDSVQKMSELIADIFTASKEQSLSISEINSAVANMDEATQQNAALVEQNNAATHQLSDLGKQLINLMAFFKTQSTNSSA